MNVLKKLHDAVLTDDGEEKKPATPALKPSGFKFDMAAAAPTPGFTSAGSPFAVPGTIVLDEAVYQRVFQKTDFDQTEAGRTIHKYFDALEGMPMDMNTKFKMALAQAAKLDGLTPDKVLGTFDSLKASLATEGDKFSRAVDGQNQKEVVGRQTQLQQINDQIAQLTQQIVDLQAKHTQISAELADAQGKVSNAQTQFQLAAQRRNNEIDQQKVQFAALLK